MTEKQIEQRLVKAVKERGGLCLKWVSPGWDGVPDRIILFAGGRIAFVEVKRPGEKPRPLQLRWHGQLKALGFTVYVLDDEKQIPEIIREVLEDNNGTRHNNEKRRL